jgi:hypothetical protein
MKVLKWSKYVKIAAATGVTLALTKSGLDIFNATQDPAWGYVSDDPQFQIMALKKKVGDANELNTLLSDRSRGWTAMEVIPSFFPEKSGIEVSNYKYNTEISPTDATNKKIPMTRKWEISGKADQKGKRLLDQLNTRKGMEAAFKQIQAHTADDSFDPDQFNRKPVVDIEISSTRSQRGGDNLYPFQFTMTLKQSFNNDDPLTLPAAK